MANKDYIWVNSEDSHDTGRLMTKDEVFTFGEVVAENRAVPIIIYKLVPVAQISKDKPKLITRHL